MEFPETFNEFVDSYGLVDTKEVYTNGSHLIPVFRVKQWLEHISAKTQMVDKSNFDEEQYKTDLQSAYDCGYNKALSENKGEWIPVTERLPEEEHEVYCQLSDGSNAVLYVQDNWGQMEWVDGLMGTGTYDVIAWREKPEPYTEGE